VTGGYAWGDLDCRTQTSIEGIGKQTACLAGMHSAG